MPSPLLEQIAADPEVARRVTAGHSVASIYREYAGEKYDVTERTIYNAVRLLRGPRKRGAPRGEKRIKNAVASLPESDTLTLDVDPKYAEAYRRLTALTATLSPEDATEAVSRADDVIYGLDRDRSKARAEARETKRLLKNAYSKIEEFEQREDYLLSLDDISPSEIPVIENSESSSDGVAFLICSDWHIEEKVDPGVVDGTNEYNPEIARQRVENLARNALKRIGKHRRDLSLDHLVLALIGDLITGYIHEELEEDNWLSPTEAANTAEEMVIGMIDYLLAEGDFRKITVPCCRGNHGRTTKKKRIATEYKNSFEWLLYKHLERYYRNEDRVEFIIPKSQSTYLEVFGRRIRFHHGDAFRYGGGVGGIFPSMMKWLYRVNQQKPCDMTFIGHWHQLMTPTADCNINGSLIGASSYGHSLGYKAEVPAQLLRILSKERGFTTFEPIFCE